jgi:hypothetical protein
LREVEKQEGHLRASRIRAVRNVGVHEVWDIGVAGDHSYVGNGIVNHNSSSDPNLQTIPANSKYAKLIKSCFVAPKGWLFCGLDFNSLEDMISALTTKDPNKLLVYIGSIVYGVRVDGALKWINETDRVHYQGSVYTGSEFATMLRTSGRVCG